MPRKFVRRRNYPEGERVKKVGIRTQIFVKKERFQVAVAQVFDDLIAREGRKRKAVYGGTWCYDSVFNSYLSTVCWWVLARLLLFITLMRELDAWSSFHELSLLEESSKEEEKELMVHAESSSFRMKDVWYHAPFCNCSHGDIQIQSYRIRYF